MERLKVSIVIPTFNSTKYIRETLVAIRGQTLQDYEILLIDDGSTDNTLEVLEVESKVDRRIKIFSKSKGGPGSARNIGLKEARGKYVAFLDSDDLWLPSKLAEQVQYMEKNKDVGFSYTDAVCFINRDGKELYIRDFVCDLQGFVFPNLFWSNFIINSTVMMRTEYISSIGFQDESTSLIGAEDYDYWLRLSRVSKLGGIQKKLTKYRLSESNTLGNSYEKAFPKHIEIYKKFYSNYSDTSEIVGMSLKSALSDLCLRYAYKNFIEGNYLLMLKKVLLSSKFSFINSIKALTLFLGNKRDWGSIVSNFLLWDTIVNKAI